MSFTGTSEKVKGILSFSLFLGVREWSFLILGTGVDDVKLSSALVPRIKMTTSLLRALFHLSIL